MLDQAKLMKQAWDMKRKMDKIQKKLKKQSITVQYNNIAIEITGAQVIQSISLNIDAEEIENVKELESELKNAINRAITESNEISKKEMKEVTGGMNIPGLT